MPPAEVRPSSAKTSRGSALKEAGVATVLIAGRRTETGADNAAEVIEGEIFDGMDVAGFLAGTLDELGVDR